MKKPPRKLGRELAWIIAIKIVLLLIIWKAFVAPYRVQVDAASMADSLRDAGISSQPQEKNNAR